MNSFLVINAHKTYSAIKGNKAKSFIQKTFHLIHEPPKSIKQVCPSSRSAYSFSKPKLIKNKEGVTGNVYFSFLPCGKDGSTLEQV